MRVHETKSSRVLFAGLVLVAIAAAVSWSYLPLQDPQSYFNFADRRMYFGIPNYFDVISNLLFVYVGLTGMLLFFSQFWLTRPRPLMLALLMVNFSVFLVGWGSSYFHMMPNSSTLFWDRAPMGMMFMALLILIIMDRVPSGIWQFLLLPLMGLGIWAASLEHDIRPYIIVQFGGALLAFIMIIFSKPRYLNDKMMITAFIAYFLAKYFEMYDHMYLDILDISGHTLKHILSAVAVFALNLAVQVPVRRYRFT